MGSSAGASGGSDKIPPINTIKYEHAGWPIPPIFDNF